jgi:hypothetical protein
MSPTDSVPPDAAETSAVPEVIAEPEAKAEPAVATANAEPEVPAASADADLPAVGAETAAPAAPGPAALSPAACGQLLKQLFPALFAGAPKPLKLRIHVDIQERAPGQFSKQTLTAFFRRYTGSTSYLLSVVRGRQRFDLDGKPAGEISDDNRKVASDELERRGVQQESRRQIEEQQRRNRAGLLIDYERTTLTRANFCVLKGVAEEELDGLLAIARDEAAQFRAANPPREAHAGPRGPNAGGPRDGRDARGPRGPRGPNDRPREGGGDNGPRPPRGPNRGGRPPR